MKRKNSPKAKAKVDSSLLIDYIIRAALGVFFAFSAGIYYRNALAAFHSAATDDLNAASLSLGFSIFASALYTMMIACLYILRHRPINKFVGIWPSVAAVLGGFLMFGLVWFPPRTDLPIEWQVIGSCLILVGNVFAAYVLTKLGRSFSILPEGRALVVIGPYKIIRHPLYAAEVISSLGTMILFLSVGAISLVVLQTVLQFVRMHYEEKVLSQTFPEYKAYAKRTWRLIPGIY